MNQENIILNSTPIEISEFKNHYEATFLISVLDEYNLNGAMIEKEDGEKYHKTIVGYPILAYLKYDKDGKPDDFGGHEVRAKYNTETKEIEYYFATHPIGSVIDSWVEDRQVEGYDGEKSVIMIKTKLWKSRFPEYFKVFDKLWASGQLSSSWEISPSKVLKTTKGRILKVFEFIGNTCLGKTVQGAVTGAGVVEVSEKDDSNYELSNAILKDFKSNNSQELSELGENPIDDINLKENKGGINGMSEKLKEDNAEVSAITENDLHSKVRKAINATNKDKWYQVSRLYPLEYRCVAYDWEAESEDDYVEFTYSVNSDETVSITSQKDVKMMFMPKESFDSQMAEIEAKKEELEKELSEKTDALVKLGEQVTQLNDQISELTPFKEQVEEAERVAKEQEIAQQKEDLKVFAMKGGYISKEEIETSEEIKGYIEELNTTQIKCLIAERVMKQLEEKEPKLETSQVEVDNIKNIKTNINEDDSKVDYASIMSSFLHK